MIVALLLLGMALTLALPMYPTGLDPWILSFAAIAALAGVLGLRVRAGRSELAALAPWVIAVALAGWIGALRGAAPQQVFEDALPYALFAAGAVASRGQRQARLLLRALIVVCVIDSAMSLARLPGWGPGIRSTFAYVKITAGLPLVGLGALALRQAGDGPARTRVAAARRAWRDRAAAAVLLLGLMATVSRGMWLAGLAGLAVHGFVRRPGRTSAAVLVLAALTLAFAEPLLDAGARFARIGETRNIEGRWLEIAIAWARFADHPLLGTGLGDLIDVAGRPRSYVHNLVAYHLWKFGLLGAALLLLPPWWLARTLWRTRRRTRAALAGSWTAIALYLVTAAAFKTYYLVWLLGVLVGTSGALASLERRAASAARAAGPQRASGSRSRARAGTWPTSRTPQRRREAHAGRRRVGLAATPADAAANGPPPPRARVGPPR